MTIHQSFINFSYAFFSSTKPKSTTIKCLNRSEFVPSSFQPVCYLLLYKNLITSRNMQVEQYHDPEPVQSQLEASIGVVIAPSNITGSLSVIITGLTEDYFMMSLIFVHSSLTMISGPERLLPVEVMLEYVGVACRALGNKSIYTRELCVQLPLCTQSRCKRLDPFVPPCSVGLC